MAGISRPTTPTEWHGFLGLHGYYRRYIIGFSDVRDALNSATSALREFKFTESMEGAFVTLKASLMSPTLFAFPNFDQQFVFGTVSSPFALSAFLAHKKAEVKRAPSPIGQQDYKASRKDVFRLRKGSAWCYNRLEEVPGVLVVIAAVR